MSSNAITLPQTDASSFFNLEQLTQEYPPNITYSTELTSLYYIDAKGELKKSVDDYGHSFACSISTTGKSKFNDNRVVLRVYLRSGLGREYEEKLVPGKRKYRSGYRMTNCPWKATLFRLKERVEWAIVVTNHHHNHKPSEELSVPQFWNLDEEPYKSLRILSDTRLH